MNKQFTVAFRKNNRSVCFEIQTQAELDSLAEQHGVENLLYIMGQKHVES